MATIDVLDSAGEKTASRDLPDELFDADVNVPLMHQVVVAGLAGIRAGTHSTKTRGDVAGGGRKPWRQKGTGRARQGSIRAPQWTGGGVAHGPTPRDHSQRTNKKMRRGALRSALTDAFRSGKLVVVEGLAWDQPKTKQAAGVLEALDVAGRVLVVLARPTETGAVERSFRNIAAVKVAYAGGLGTYDVLLADRVVLTADAVDALAGGRRGDGGEVAE
ncbi:MAG TPA: 50S ribosomal protein L4 [Actinomycetota bacterium]|nr:50S ribosomal protein L4 [Actinomycetota bacterium]